MFAIEWSSVAVLCWGRIGKRGRSRIPCGGRRGGCRLCGWLGRGRWSICPDFVLGVVVGGDSGGSGVGLGGLCSTHYVLCFWCGRVWVQ